MYNTLKKTINAEEQLAEHKEENMMKNTKEQLIEHKPLGFTRPKNAGALLLFAVLALSRPEHIAAVTEGDFEYVFAADGSRITGYTGSAVDLIIPAMLGGKAVKSIGTAVFSGQRTLQSVSFPSSLTAIGRQSFRDCTGLTQLSLPDSLLSIEQAAFQNCTGLTQAVIPASVTQLGGYPFFGCTKLRQIEVHSNNLHFSAQDGVLFNKEKTQLWQYPGGKSGPYALPGSVERIESFAFNLCGELTEVTIPASVDLFANSAFRNCAKLRRALFEGDAPSTFGTRIFDNAAAEFKVQFYEGASGFTIPTWMGYPSESVARPAFFLAWLNSFGLAADDLAANGEPLLIAYALNLNPTNPAVRLPVPFVESSAIRLDFPTERPGVSLMVERSTDLPAGNWQLAGVETNSGTASVSIPLIGSESPEKLYLRFTAQEE